MTRQSSRLAVPRPGRRPLPSPHWATTVEATRRALIADGLGGLTQLTLAGLLAGLLLGAALAGQRAWRTTSGAETAPAGPLASRTLVVAVPGAHDGRVLDASLLELDLAPLASVRLLLWLVVTAALGAFVGGRPERRPERRSAGPVHGPGASHRAAP